MSQSDPLIAALEVLRERGLPAEHAFALCRSLRVDFFGALRAIRTLYGLSIEAAKEVAIKATGTADSLQDYQSKLLAALRELEVDSSSAAPT